MELLFLGLDFGNKYFIKIIEKIFLCDLCVTENDYNVDIQLECKKI